MAFKAEQCPAWIEAHGGTGERFISHLVTGTRVGANPTPTVGMRSGMEFTGTQAVAELARRLGLDEAHKVGFGVESSFLAVTDRHVYYGTRSSFRDRPKDLVHRAPIGSFTLYWVDDDTGAGNRFRHLLLDFGDGHWRGERIGLAALGKDMSSRTNLQHCFDALGDRARPIQL